MGYNHVTLLGNLVADIDLRETNSGTAVTDIRLAVDDVRSKTDKTLFVDVTLWGRDAEVANEYLRKGSPVLVDGRLQMDQWETPEGAKRSKIKVVASRMKLVGSRRDNNGESGPPPQDETIQTSEENSSNNGENGDDIPF